ncbi:MAG: alanine--tRNA ligase [Clostridia bacterium]|nr:alanine--tRNA ligase [Clostridia bacterium]
MKWTGLNELREKYLNFFESKGHLKLPSFPLIPQGDKSLLLINSGMAPMKKYFTGEITPPRNRVTTCQKCIRTPDIENVGKTARHGTYFEMLGNFSFGDYFKREAISWAWEFCTKVIELPVDRLYISVYLEDDEAYDIWTKEIGIAEDHMVRFGKEDNFWEHGTGPCGPCSEIYFDRGEKYGCGSPDCKVGCECDRYIEFWNLVFTQFSSDGEGNYTNLEKRNIDTGMGLERLACICQDVANLFEVDTVQNIMKHIMDISGIKYHEDEKNDVSLRVITDHIRSTTFMVGDGVMPSNEGRGYVLRRLLRRAARHGRLLGIKDSFLYEVAKTVIKENESAYPLLVEKQDYIIKIIKNEEENFAKTIDTGLQILNEMIENLEGTVLSGEDAYKLSDTYGLPLDLAKEILEEKGLTIDEARFTEISLEHKRHNREVQMNLAGSAWKNTENATEGLDSTAFCGYETTETEAKVIAIIKDGEKVEYAENGDAITVVLDKTSFYGESGGQAGDNGKIIGADYTVSVMTTGKTHDAIMLHHGVLEEGESIKVGDTVTAKVDEFARNSTKRNHTAAHILQAALRKVLGSHVEQAGQLVNANQVRFDFTHFAAMTAEELKKVEMLVNETILNALEVETSEMGIEEAKALGAMALFGEKYGDVVRVVNVKGFSIELCGGTHVDNTAKLGLFKIVSESSVAAGVRRIEGVTGFGTLDFIDNKVQLINNTAKNLKVANVNELETRAAGVMADLKAKEKEVDALSQKLSAIKAQSIMDSGKEINGVSVISVVMENVEPNDLRKMCDDIKASDGDKVAVLISKNTQKGVLNIATACSVSAVKKGAHAGNLAKQVAAIAGGSGGGRPDGAMAGGKDITKAEEASEAVYSMVEEMLK